MSGILGQIAHKFIEGSVGVIVDENLKGIAERERYHQTGNRKNTGPFQTEFEKKREQDIQNHNIRINSEVDFCENNYIEISSRLENKHLFQIVGPCYIKVISTSTTITPRQSTTKKFTNYILDRLDAIFVVIFIIIILVVIYFLLHLVLWLFDLLPIF